METLKINIPIIFLILPTANYPQKEGFIYWILQLIVDVKSVWFFLDHPAPDRQLLAGQDVEQRSMRLKDR